MLADRIIARDTDEFERRVPEIEFSASRKKEAVFDQKPNLLIMVFGSVLFVNFSHV